MQGFFCFLRVAIFTVLTGCRTKPELQPREETRAMVQVPIHERGTQDKPLEKLFHVIFIGINRINFCYRYGKAQRSGEKRQYE